VFLDFAAALLGAAVRYHDLAWAGPALPLGGGRHAGQARLGGLSYAAFYEGSLRLAPYAAHYFMLVALGKVMNLLLAHKLIVALYIAAMPLSTASLLVACGRSRVPALLAFPLAYNLTLHYGFISFALSLPVLMLLLAQVVKHLHSEPAR